MEWDFLIAYIIRVAPGVALAITMLVLLPKHQMESRIFCYIMLFILLRDAMTPLGFWRFGAEGVFWMRFTCPPQILWILGGSSLLLVALMYFVEPELRKFLVWQENGWKQVFVWGGIGTAIVVAPAFLLYLSTPLEMRGGKVAAGMLLPILFMSLAGNLYEEVLFRGYFQGYIQDFLTPRKAVVCSGVCFAFAHIFLASTVMNTALPFILVFCLYEGLAAAFVRMKAGLLAAAITHGMAIFLISAGLF